MENNGDITAAEQAATRKKRGPIIALIVLALVIGAALLAYNALSPQARDAQSEATSAQTAEHDPELPRLADYDATVYSYSGQAHKLTEIAGGKPFVMNFWATWCPYCIQEMPDYSELVQEYGERVSFAFVDVADGKRETVDDAALWLADNGFDLPDYYDTDLEATALYGASSLPTTVVVAANGDIMSVTPGMIDPELMRKALDSLLDD